MPFKPHLSSPSLAPSSEGMMQLTLKLGSVNFANNALMQEQVEICHNGKPLALGRLIRENGEVSVEIETLLT
jgi:flagellar motor switch/type III secretory pathway protein FliN